MAVFPKHKLRIFKPQHWSRQGGFRSLRTLLARFGKQSLVERLGYGPDARLLIVHADDLGLAQAVNSAFFKGLEAGGISSGSVMVPCPFFPEVAAFSKAHPEADIGLHLTLTSDPSPCRWMSVASKTHVSSLVDEDGYFHERWHPDIKVSIREVEIELRAQIEKAYAAGLRPTHLDSHQHALQMQGSDLFEVYLRLGREYRLPVLIGREWFSRFSYMQPSLRRRDVVLDRIISITPRVTPEQWPIFYRRAIEKLLPGVTEILVHPGYENHELKALFGDRPICGAAWRQRDLDFFASHEFQVLLEKHDVKLTTWREIAKRMQ